MFDKDTVGKDTSLGRVEVNLVDLRGVKGKWLALQVSGNHRRRIYTEEKATVVASIWGKNVFNSLVR